MGRPKKSQFFFSKHWPGVLCSVNKKNILQSIVIRLHQKETKNENRRIVLNCQNFLWKNFFYGLGGQVNFDFDANDRLMTIKKKAHFMCSSFRFIQTSKHCSTRLNGRLKLNKVDPDSFQSFHFV